MVSRAKYWQKYMSKIDNYASKSRIYNLIIYILLRGPQWHSMVIHNWNWFIIIPFKGPPSELTTTFLVILDIIPQYPISFNNIWHYSIILDIFLEFSILFHNIWHKTTFLNHRISLRMLKNINPFFTFESYLWWHMIITDKPVFYRQIRIYFSQILPVADLFGHMSCILCLNSRK